MPTARPRITLLRSNPVSPDPRVEKEARLLSELAEVTILAWDRTGTLPRHEERAYATIERFNGPAPYGSLAILGQLVRFNLWLAWKLLRHPGNIVHACDLDTGFTAALVSLIRRFPLVYDMFDMYAEANSELLPAPALRLAVALESWVVRVARVTIIVDEARRAQIKGMRPKQLAVIYNAPEDQGAATPTQNSKLEVFYAGVLAKNRGFAYLVKAIAGLPKVHLSVAGFGQDEEFVRQEVESHQATFLGRIPYEEVLEHSRQADVLFALYDPIVKNHRYSSPNKLFEAMMLGKPIIVSDGTGMSDIVTKVGNGLVVPYGDADALTAAVGRLTDPKLRQEMGVKGRRAYEATYGWTKMADTLRGVYAELLGCT